MRPLIFTIQAAALTCVWFFLTVAAGAAPNTDDPDDTLATRNDAKVQGLATEAAEQYKTAHEIITEMVDKLDADQTIKINPKQFGTSFVAILRLERLGRELEDAGETAGIDFQLRALALRSEWQRVKTVFFQAAGVNAKLPPIYLKVKADATNRSRKLVAVQKLIDQEDWEQAGEIIHEEIEELEDLGCWLKDATRQPLFPFEEMRDQIVPKLREQRRAAAIEQLTTLREQTTPDFEHLLSQLQQGEQDLKAGKNPSFDGQECTGPEFLQKAGAAWQQLHLQAIQSLGIDWARGMRMGEPESKPLEDLLKGQKEFASSVVPSMADIIMADRSRDHTSDATTIYAAYVKVLAPLMSLTDKQEIETLQSALESFAASNPSLAADVKAYDAVTSDLLRWKKRLATAQQKNVATQYPDFATTANPSLAFVPSPEVGKIATGLIKADAKNTSEIAILSSIPKSLERIKQELLGKQVTLPAATGLNPAKKLVASNFHHRHYATFTLPTGYDEQVAVLKADLLSSDTLPPLTLEAAMAIAAADRGDLQASGVTIKKVYVEPLSTRMATLPAVARPLVPLGTLPAEHMSEPSLSQLLLRTDVQPSWVRNQYFFVPPQP